MDSIKQPLIVCWGMGQDSTGMLIGMKERNITPELVIVADVGSERHETYQFRPIFDDWLESVGFPRSVAVQYQPQNYKHWPPHHSLLENYLTNVTLPSLAYGHHTCSAKWKITPINKYVAGLRWAENCLVGHLRKTIRHLKSRTDDTESLLPDRVSDLTIRVLCFLADGVFI